MLKKEKFKISGMHCASCSMNIEGALEELSGIKNASANYARGEVVVEYEESAVGKDTIQETITSLGYKVVDFE